MPLQTIEGGLWIPHATQGNETATNLEDMLLDAIGESAAMIFRAPKAGVISKVGFLTGVVTTGGTVDVRLEGVATNNGDPDGSLISAGANADQIIGDGDDDTWFLTTLDTPPTVTRGQLIAAVIVNPVTAVMNIRRFTNLVERTHFPYTDHFASSSWTKKTSTPIFAVEYNDGSYAHIPGSWPIISAINTTWRVTDTPDERALRFKFPFGTRVSGFWIDGSFGNRSITVNLYEGTTSLVAVLLDDDQAVDTPPSPGFFKFDTDVELEPDVVYRLAIEPLGGAGGDYILREVQVENNAKLAQMDGGTEFFLSTRVDAGAWTDVDDERPMMGLILDGISIPPNATAMVAGLSGGFQ